MPPSIEIDETLLADTMAVTGLSSPQAAVEAALRDLVRARRRQALKELWGMGWDGDLEAMRNASVARLSRADFDPVDQDVGHTAG
ncbi:MAG: hypothetical protein RLY86_2392 [Pseudomonadota bacterium]|jgi:Arc/MetJ family transcription regulator